ncbi:MAG: hypothetical protein CVT98_05275 [Bacteroidetes bacterium HGW-Bacteroidetes-15]|nr:MAG: hypothetical protein CVT98_05275 [Bacteroidetes bacterium HGW-Bacteroidetes-15]
MIIDVLKNYFSDNEVIKAQPFGNGHINDTFKVDLAGIPISYILQRINSNVFKNPRGIIDNHLRLQEHYLSYDQSISITKLVPNAKGDFITFDDNGDAWRLTDFINDSYSIEIIDRSWQAFEAGFAFGSFANNCNKLNPNDFIEAIKDFHRLSFRLKQLTEAIENDRAGRLKSVKSLVDFFKQREGKLADIQNLVDMEAIPLRVVHNDTKINNLLFRGDKAVAIVDLDTLGPGILFNDYGDALRTIACTSREDEKDISKVSFNFDAFTEFSKGYLNQVKGIVTKAEKEYFYLAPVLLTFIMGIRFLTDFLNGDIYYKISYPNHNIDRCKVQVALIESMESREAEMKSIINELLS